jgi:FAD/FMN-containing dehydrogenase
MPGSTEKRPSARGVKATYRDNFERLVAIKNEYDPTNLFRVNHSIRPTATV